jgi:hypothetical protein
MISLCSRKATLTVAVCLSAIVIAPSVADASAGGIVVAYIGPGAGLGAIGALLAVLATIVIGLVGLILYPLQLLRNKRRRREPQEESVANSTQT